ncbi:hypothetical protein ONS96_001110 [Cadophora gregata f. sp. sojae]|nr:hypothetical protein ONS96_001110 [Cadophora gregata f. sp. sojae]
MTRVIVSTFEDELLASLPQSTTSKIFDRSALTLEPTSPSSLAAYRQKIFIMDSQDQFLDTPREIFYSANTSPVRPLSAAPSIAVTATEGAVLEETDTSRIETSPTTVSSSPTSVYTTAVAGFCFCGKPCDGLCSGCCDTPGQEDTYYCSSKCQDTDRPAHRQICKAVNTLRSLYRAAECLQEIYYMYRAKTFDRLVTKIEKTKEGGHTQLIVHEDKSRRPTNDLQYLHKLPHDLFGEDSQDDEDNENKDKRAILTHGVSAQSIVWMHDLIGYFLSNCAYTISEQRVVPVPGTQSVLIIDSQGYPDLYPREHFILVITLHNLAGTYALDLCGAQYGHFNTLTPFSEYSSRGLPNAPPTPFSGRHSMRWGVNCVRNEQSRRGALTRINLLASEKLVSGAVEWEKEYGTRIESMLQASPEVFQNRKEGLVHYLAYEVQTRLDDMAVRAAAAEDAKPTVTAAAAAFVLDPRITRI